MDQACRVHEGRDRARRAQDAAFRFLSAVGGDRPGYEETIRALFAGDRDEFEAEIRGWPADLRAHGTKLAADAPRGPDEDGAAGEER